ncbi:MAG: hypothetical protein QM486_11800 [Flavobacteriaceae bacterium]
MKNLIALMALILSLNMSAQKMNNTPQRGMLPNFTPEQHATIKSKQMALHLDLNKQQEKQVYGLVLKQEESKEKFRKKRRAAFINGERPTEAQQFDRMNKGLDSKITFQKNLKNILSNKQYTQWKKEAGKRAQMRQKMKNNHPRKKGGSKKRQRQRF